MKRNQYIPILLLLISSTGWLGCSKFLENELPSTTVRADEALRTREDIARLTNSIYDVVANTYNGTCQRFSDLMSDDVFVDGNSGHLVQIYNRASDFFNSDVGGYYNMPYLAILRANYVLENHGSIEMSDADHDRFEGEALFIRGMSHFNLVNHFAQPFGYTQENSHLGIVVKTSSEPLPQTRNTVKEVYDQVIADLQRAAELLPEENGIYANKYAAEAWLAKVYFQMNDYARAYEQAEIVINSGKYTFSSEIDNRYLNAISPEGIFTTISTSIEDNRASQLVSQYDSRGDRVPFIKASANLVNEVRTNGQDLRNVWYQEKTLPSGGRIFVFTKYNIDFFNVCLASLTEMMLISAESAGELNQNIDKARGYLNRVRKRAELEDLPGSASAALIVADARTQRRIEFAGEGMRLMDLKRRGAKGEAVIVRGAPWNCNGMVLQFPASEIAVAGFQLNPEGGCN